MGGPAGAPESQLAAGFAILSKPPHAAAGLVRGAGFYAPSSTARITGCITWMKASAVRYAPAAMVNIGQ